MFSAYLAACLCTISIACILASYIDGMVTMQATQAYSSILDEQALSNMMPLHLVNTF